MTKSPDIYLCVFTSYVRKCEIQNKTTKTKLRCAAEISSPFNSYGIAATQTTLLVIRYCTTCSYVLQLCRWLQRLLILVLSKMHAFRTCQ